MRDVVFIMAASVFLLITSAASAITYIYPAECNDSYSKGGDENEDLTTRSGQPINCDFLSMTLPENGHILIQIGERHGQNTPLAFGASEFKPERNFIKVLVERIYLPHSQNPSKPQVVDSSEGLCFLDTKPDILTLSDVFCEATVIIGKQKRIYHVKAHVTGAREFVPGL